jgi:hypothetical protein
MSFAGRGWGVGRTNRKCKQNCFLRGIFKTSLLVTEMLSDMVHGVGTLDSSLTETEGTGTVRQCTGCGQCVETVFK